MTESGVLGMRALFTLLRIREISLTVEEILETIVIGLCQVMHPNSTGKVKFYSTDKGYGFIHDGGSGKDIFFHVTAVVGPDAPSTGDVVSFEVSEEDRKGRVAASRVEIVESTQSIHQQRSRLTLNDFPCIKGGSIAGFGIARRLGRVSAGNGFFITYYSVNEARDALINSAKSKGANGILNFVWHREHRRRSYSTKQIFGDGYNYHHKNNDYFWCEGDAVLLTESD